MVASATTWNGRHASPPPDDRRYYGTEGIKRWAAEQAADAPLIPLDAAGRQLTYSYDDLLTLDVPPALQLVEGLIEEETAGIVGGVPNVGETWLILTMARAVASGTPWLGHFATVQGPVLVVDEESHLPGVVSRAKMLDAADPLGRGLPLHVAVGRGLRLDDRKVADLDRDMTRTKPVLLILDSLTRLHSGNENVVAEMAQTFANAKALMRAHCCAVVFTDHVRKRLQGLGDDDPENALRGSSEKRAWCDFILAAEAIKDDPTGLVVRHIKSRHGRKLDPFSVRLELDPDAGTVRLVHGGEAQADAATRGGDIAAAIDDIQQQLGPVGADAVALAGWLSCSTATVHRHAKGTLAGGLIASRKLASGAKGGQGKTGHDVKECD